MYNDSNVKVGDLLLYKPLTTLSPGYKDAVILIIEHDEYTGSVGIIMNFNTPVKLNDILRDFPLFKAPVHYGGQNNKDKVSFIHRIPSLEDKVTLNEIKPLYYGGNEYQLRSLISERKIRNTQIAFYSGHEEWMPGVLEEEVANDMWIVCDSTPYEDLLFNTEYNELWNTILRRENSPYEFFSHYHDHFQLN